MKNYMLECCIDSTESAIAATQGGGDRLELCAALQLGGITPGINLYRQVNSFSHLPVNVLIRPRFGDFCFTPQECDLILRDVCMFADEGVNGVVIGALTPDGRLNMPFMRELCACGGKGGCAITLHRAFDMCVDPFEALEQAVELGISTILTSGQRSTAAEGSSLLAELRKAAAGRLEILVGSGVNSRNIKQLVDATGCRAYHLSAKAVLNSSMTFRREGLSMGLPLMSEYDLWRTDSAEVAAVKQILKNYPDPQ